MPDAVPAPTTRYVPAGGRSRTISGAIKMFIGVGLHLVLKVSGWTLPETMQSEIVDGLGLMIVLGLELYGGVQVYLARQSRGDLDATGKRVAAVEVIVQPPAEPPEGAIL